MSPDLKIATAYVMPLGGGDVAAVIAALNTNRKYIRGEVARGRRIEVRTGCALPCRRNIR